VTTSKFDGLAALTDVAKLAAEVAGTAIRRKAECEREDRHVVMERAKRDAHLETESIRLARVAELDARLALLRASPNAPGAAATMRQLEAERRRALRA